MPEVPLPRSAPAAEGVDAAGLGRFVDALERAPAIDPHGLMVLRHGRVVAEGWWAPYSPERLHLLYSLSKTFLSAAAGIAVGEGLLTPDDALVDHFPAFRDEVPAASRAIRVRDALAMATGHRQDMLGPAVLTDPVEPVRGFLLHAPEAEPGALFTYNQPATYTVAAIVQQAAGEDLVTWLRPRLLDPLGIGPVSWQQYPPGRAIGFSGLHATTEAAAKLGQLLLADGRWEGRRVLPEGWVAEMSRRHVGTDGEAQPDWAAGYGYQVWMSRHGYRADGAYGQLAVILPEHDAVVVTTMATEDAQSVLDAVWEHVLPALAGPGDAAADDALVERLADLRLPPSAGDPEPSGDVPQRWSGVGLTAERRADGRIRLDDGRSSVLVPVGRPGWTTVDDDPASAPVAVSGGWRGDLLVLDLVLLEGPHRLDVRLEPGGAAIATWRTEPLVLDPATPYFDQRAPLPLG